MSSSIVAKRYKGLVETAQVKSRKKKMGAKKYESPN